MCRSHFNTGWIGFAALVLVGFAECAGAEEVRRLNLLSFRADAEIRQPQGFFPVLAYDAELRLETAGEQNWLHVGFRPSASQAKEPFSAVLFEFNYAAAVEPFDAREAPDGSADWPNVWLGWNALEFDYENPQADPLTLTVVVQDWVSWSCPKYDGLQTADGKLPQLYEEEVTLRPGRGTASMDLKRRPLWSNDKRKGLALDDVRAFGLCLKSPTATTALRVNHFRLTGSSPAAGVLKPLVVRAQCEPCGKSCSDAYAPFCPFCGAEKKQYRKIPAEFPSFEGKLILSASDGGGGRASSGGGGDSTDVPTGPREVVIGHYDIYYNKAKGAAEVARRSGHWENRYYLEFKLAPQVRDPTKIKQAELWLFASFTGGEFTTKPWLPGILVFEVNPRYAPAELSQVNWMSLPTYDRLLYVSGQHPGPATQNPKLKTNELPAPRCLPLDLTEAVREAAERGDPVMLLGLKAFTVVGAAPEPHGLGHFLRAYGPAAQAENRRPQLVISLSE